MFYVYKNKCEYIQVGFFFSLTSASDPKIQVVTRSIAILTLNKASSDTLFQCCHNMYTNSLSKDLGMLGRTREKYQRDNELEKKHHS